jgi:tellurite resistance protein
MNASTVTSQQLHAPVAQSHAGASVRYLPVNLFGGVMGLSGLAMAWRLAHASGAPAWIGETVAVIAVVVFLVLAGAYLVKLVRHTDAVRAEWAHPISGNFFGTVAISLLLLSGVVSPWHPGIGHVVWAVGSLVTLLLGFRVVSLIVRGGLEPAHFVPAWLIPGVASLDIAVTGARMPMAWAPELNLVALAIGGTLALVLYALILFRLATQPALPAMMKPSLMILVAPFAVGFLAYVNITGQFDRFASVLFYFGLFAFAVVAPMVFRRGVPFSPTWWAISFPMAALVNAALRYAGSDAGWPLQVVAWSLLALLTVALTVLLVRTLHILFTGHLLRA